MDYHTSQQQNNRERNPWDKQHGESWQAFQAFSTYLLMGNGRTLAKTGKQLGKGHRLMEDWSKKWSWMLRVSAYEEHFTLKALDATEDDRIELVREHLHFASSVLRRARARLERIAEQMPEPTGDPDLDRSLLESLAEQGRLMTVDQALRAGDLAVKVGRLATGLDGKYVPPGTGSTDISNMDPADLDLLESLLDKAQGG